MRVNDVVSVSNPTIAGVLAIGKTVPVVSPSNARRISSISVK